MPSTASTNGTPNSKSPFEKIQQRAADYIPGMAAAAHAIGLENQREIMGDARSRTRDAHKAMARAAGMEDLVTEPDMGDLTVTGDQIHNHYHQTPPVAAQDAPGSTPAVQASWLKKALPYAAAAALAAGTGTGGFFLSKALAPAAPTLIEKTIENRSGFNIELVQPKAP